TGPRSLSTGDLLARFVGDVDALQDVWARVVVPAASAVVVGAAGVALSTALSPLAGLSLALSLVTAAIVAPMLSQAAAHGAGRRLAPLRGRYETELLDVLAGVTDLAVYGALDARLERLGEVDRSLARAEARTSAAGAFGTALAVVVGGAATVAGLGFGAAAVAAGTLAPVNVAVVALVPFALHEIVANVSAAAHRLPDLAAAAGRVREVFDRPAPVVEPTAPLPVPSGPLGVRVRGLVAGYTPGRPPALDGVDLDLPAGSRTMVVGESGSGKSTLAAVLLRFLDPVAGRVELIAADGTAVDICAADGDDVRAAIAWCAQDAHLFDSTIEANLRLARPDATPTELRQALERAQLAAWVDSLPDGLDTPVGEHGGALSGGQRQRLALARVLLADKPIVVFDEPTEHLDEPTARALAADLLAATEDRTVLVLTHRPELFEAIDHVVRLEDGRAVSLTQHVAVA
ncbi:MAG TPA: thiol reductant ABC exporter subunit CydC, partial [Acidimicrobiales bacterium]